MFTSAQTFTRKLFDFQKDFLDRNVELFEDDIRRLNMIISLKESSKLREKWLIENNKMREFRKLQREVNALVVLAKKLQVKVNIS